MKNILIKIFIIICFQNFLNVKGKFVYTKYNDNKELRTIDSLIKSQSYKEAIQYLLRVIEKVENNADTVYLCLLYEKMASTYLLLNIPEKAIEYFKEIIKFEKTDFIISNEIYEKYADALLKANQYNEARQIFRKILPLYEEEKFCEKRLKLYNKLRQTYTSVENIDEIIKIDKEILNVAKFCKNNQNIFRYLNNIGYDYFKLNNYKDALEYFYQAFEFSKNIVKDIDISEIINVQVNIAISLYNLGEINLSLQNLLESREKARKAKLYYHLARIENIMSYIYLFSGDLHNASVIGWQSIKNAQLSKNTKLLQECYYTYSQILKECNDPVNALNYYEKYLHLRDSLKYIEEIKKDKFHRDKIEMEKFENEIKLKIADENIYKMKIRQLELEKERQRQINDSLEQEKKLNQLKIEKELQESRLIKERLEKEVLENKMIILKNINEKQEYALKAEKEEKERKQLEIEKLEAIARHNAIQRSRAIMMVVFMLIIVLSTLSGLFVLRRKNQLLAKQRDEIRLKNLYLEQLNSEINIQKKKIEEKNQAITDSIMYAKKIQNALLPMEELFQKFFSEYFIFFQPRDIVSGDFYWIMNISDKIVFAVADCTGHGVPGALMSMLGIAFLNEIVSNMKQLHTDYVLLELRKKVINVLKQKGEDGETKDGMDIAICIIDLKLMTLEYSGAYNSLILIKNNELKIYKGDRMPIGIHERDKELFTRHQIKISKGDVLYMFTDGFADQFGGKEGKKFKLNNFYNLLYNLHNEPMRKQKNLISDIFNKWKENFDQIDDVLVVGIRI